MARPHPKDPKQTLTGSKASRGLHPALVQDGLGAPCILPGRKTSQDSEPKFSMIRATGADVQITSDCMICREMNSWQWAGSTLAGSLNCQTWIRVEPKQGHEFLRILLRFKPDILQALSF